MPRPAPVRGPVGALDVGGTHCTAALVDPDRLEVLEGPVRADVDAQADAGTVLDSLATAAAGLTPAPRWAVAMPDPFDYARGVGRFRGVGKFAALDGVDVGAALQARLPGAAAVPAFVNDADAFALGEALAGAGRGAERVVGLTLGTGVGSGWVRAGHVVVPDTPPGGRAHRLLADRVPLEDRMSRRALRRAWVAAGGEPALDVREIAALARRGDEVAARVLRVALTTLGAVLAGPVTAFGADIMVVGGSMAGSWPLFEAWFVEGWSRAVTSPPPPLVVAGRPATAALLGAVAALVRA